MYYFINQVNPPCENKSRISPSNFVQVVPVEGGGAHVEQVRQAYRGGQDRGAAGNKNKLRTYQKLDERIKVRLTAKLLDQQIESRTDKMLGQQV